MSTSVTKSSENQVSISLNCTSHEFGEFLSGLLGKPQVISRLFPGNFSLSLEDIENFYHLIEQRVRDQNESTMVQFSATIYYNNGSSVQIGSIEDLRKYSEIRPLVSGGVSLTFIHLIKFQGRKDPEKQQIDIDIRVTSSLKYQGGGFIVLGDVMIPVGSEEDGEGKFQSHHTGFIGFRVSHTSRTWGGDIENLLTSHIENFVSSKIDKNKMFVRKTLKIITAVNAFFIMFALTGLGNFLLQKWSDKIISEYKGSIEGSEFELISVLSRLDVITSFLFNGITIKIGIAFSMFVIVSTLLSWRASEWISSKARTPEPSFILLTRQSELRKKEIMKKYERRWQLFVVAFVVNVISGVGGNIVFQLIAN